MASSSLPNEDTEFEDGVATRDAVFFRDKRIVEALLFASERPLAVEDFRFHLGKKAQIDAILAQLAADFAPRGVNLKNVAGKWALRTAEDLGYLLIREKHEPRKLSRAAMETLAIVAYHQPVTRAEIEDIRGVATSKGTLDVLLETGWVRLRGRRKAPGRPVTYGTTEAFLVQFGLQAITELPGLAELKGAGFFDGRLPANFNVPEPSDSSELQADEDPLEEDLFVAISEERLGAEEERLEAEAGE
ncbi:MAG: SMC-Scp complex subunit ScpB [Alphaproteobacteria bacterium]|nr:SMC-Scp complex subunit ScpB [Alphaproteobacteria bacterium]